MQPETTHMALLTLKHACHSNYKIVNSNATPPGMVMGNNKNSTQHVAEKNNGICKKSKVFEPIHGFGWNLSKKNDKH